MNLEIDYFKRNLKLRSSKIWGTNSLKVILNLNFKIFRIYD
jgi:hypothetical protein